MPNKSNNLCYCHGGNAGTCGILCHKPKPKGNPSYRRGRRLEWQVKKDLEKDGWTAMRTAGSHGFADIIAIKYFGSRTEIRFIQCKTSDKEENVKKLLHECIKKSPIKFTWNAGPVRFTQELIIKIMGSSQYKIYPVEFVNE